MNSPALHIRNVGVKNRVVPNVRAICRVNSRNGAAVDSCVARERCIVSDRGVICLAAIVRNKHRAAVALRRIVFKHSLVANFIQSGKGSDSAAMLLGGVAPERGPRADHNLGLLTGVVVHNGAAV